jgi:hypothetical protein
MLVRGPAELLNVRSTHAGPAGDGRGESPARDVLFPGNRPNVLPRRVRHLRNIRQSTKARRLRRHNGNGRRDGTDVQRAQAAFGTVKMEAATAVSLSERRWLVRFSPVRMRESNFKELSREQMRDALRPACTEALSPSIAMRSRETGHNQLGVWSCSVRG